MNNNINGLPTTVPIRVHVLGAQRSALYQQHTYMDRNQMAITDFVYQEQVSQFAWGMAALPHQTFVPNADAYLSGMSHRPSPSGQSTHGYRFGPRASQHAQGTAAGSPHSYSHMYASRSSSFQMGAYFNSQAVRSEAPQPSMPAQDAKPAARRQCDASTQTDDPPLVNVTQASSMNETSSLQADNSDDSDYMPSTSNKNNSFDYTSGCGDGPNLNAIQQGTLRNSEVVLPMQRMNDITRVCLNGSKIAQKLAETHRSRPCFKKIDTLCARLKQDLVRPDGVLPNINSQGIAWAVKDFIFAFTRIINAWVIVKGYVYNSPEPLNKIKDQLPNGFMAAFDAWQCNTLMFADYLIQSFVNLDRLLQQQKNTFIKLDDSNCSTDSSTMPPADLFNSGCTSTPNESSRKATCADLKNSVDLNYLYNMIDDSEETQRTVDANGTYLKSGTYTPLKKDAKVKLKHDANVLAAANQNLDHNLPKMDANPDAAPRAYIDIKPFVNQGSIVGIEIRENLQDLASQLLEMEEADIFFHKHFMNNYYPHMHELCHDRFDDIRTIVLACEENKYNHVYEAIHDLRRIIFIVRIYLEKFNNKGLKDRLDLFEKVLKKMLSKPPYVPNQFDHITGRPGEKLFIYEI